MKAIAITTPQQNRTQSTAQIVRRRVLRSRDRVWRTEDFDGTHDAIQSEFRRLVRADELRHVRRGVYWRGHKTRFGMTAPQAGTALRNVLGKRTAIGATGWYASNLLGLSTQVPPVESLAVSVRPPSGFQNLKLVDRSQRVGRNEARLSDLEVTFLEAIEGWDQYVEVKPRRAVEKFEQMIEKGDVRINRLVTAARTEPPVVRERLRHLLGAVGRSDQARDIDGARSQSARRRALAVFPAGRLPSLATG